MKNFDWRRPDRPYAIAHRGASAYAPESSFRAFEVAAELGADFWELDIRMTADKKLAVYHDPLLPDGRFFELLSWKDVKRAARQYQIEIPLLKDVLKLAAKAGTGIYADIKDTAATLPTFEALRTYGIERAILGAFDPDAARQLRDVQCPYPTSVLVPIGADPFLYSERADIIHLCWEHMDRPQDLLDEAFFEQAKQENKLVALWHEEDPIRMSALRTLPVLGICSDRPELVRPFEAPIDWPLEVVCHRGAESIAPENTLEAARCAFGAGFSYVEIDVRQSKDGELVLMHDPSLSRTTNGDGLVAEQTYDMLKGLDAGGWFSDHFAGERIPTFEEMIELAKLYQGKLYVEIKDADPETVLNRVRSHGLMDRCFFWSFNNNLLREIRERDVNANIMVRRQDFNSLQEALEHLSPSVIEFAMSDNLSELEMCRPRNIQTMIAYMGKSSKKIQRIIELRPDLVNLAQPFLFRRILEQI